MSKPDHKETAKRRAGEGSRFAQPGALATRKYVPGATARDARETVGAADPLKLSSNENLLGTSAGALQAIRDAAPRVCNYPDAGSREVRARLSELLGAPAAAITTGNGADGVLYNLGMAVIDQGAEVIIPQTTFPIYDTISRVMRGVPVISAMDGLRIDLDDILARVGPRTRVIFLCNPNNPTGDNLPPEAVAAFLDRVPAHVLVVLDEAYIDFVDEEVRFDGVARLRAGMDNLFLLRSLSKIHGLAGVRFGYGVGDPELIALMERVKPPFDVSVIAEEAALAALSAPEFARRSVELCAVEMRRACQALEAMGLAYVPSWTNFVLVETGRDALEVTRAMMLLGVLVRPGTAFGLPTHIRATIGRPDATERLLEALGRTLEQGSTRRA